MAEVVLLDDVGHGEAAKHVLEDLHHGGRSLPAGGHGVGHLGQASRGAAAHPVETLLILDRV